MSQQVSSELVFCANGSSACLVQKGDKDIDGVARIFDVCMVLVLEQSRVLETLWALLTALREGPTNITAIAIVSAYVIHVAVSLTSHPFCRCPS